MPAATLAIPFDARSTARDVLSDVSLAGQTILLTGCTSGIGFETLRALAERGAHVVALARSERAARDACERAGGRTTPLSCDLEDLASVTAATRAVRALGRPLDAIVANAGIVAGTRVERLYGIEKTFLVNHVAHFHLITGLLDRVRDDTGRIVVVSSATSVDSAPPEGIMFDNLDAGRGYAPRMFYAQSKLANALFARELSRRLAPRGIAANAAHPGVVLGTRLFRGMAGHYRMVAWLGRRLTKSPAQGAATQVLLAASPLVAGVSGHYWADCQIAAGSRHLEDEALASRLWSVTEDIVRRALGPAPDRPAARDARTRDGAAPSRAAR